MALISRENAAKLQAIGVKNRLAKKHAQITAAQEILNTVNLSSDQAALRRRERLEKQLDMLAAMIEQANVEGKTTLILRLMAAQKKVWELLYPKPGSYRPRPEKRRMAMPIAEPLWDEISNTGIKSHNVSNL